MVFDAPPAEVMGCSGTVNNGTVKYLTIVPCVDMLRPVSLVAGITDFQYTYKTLEAKLPLNDVVNLVPQKRLAGPEAEAWYRDVVDGSGEGLMLRAWFSSYEVKRSKNLLKLKPECKGSGVVVGFVEGVDRLTGTLGALQVREDTGVSFRLGTGFSDLVRKDIWAARDSCLGRGISFLYRERTLDGVPREGRFVGFK